MTHYIAKAATWLWAKCPKSAIFWTAAATIAIAFTTVFQWTEMRKVTRATQESADAAKSAADTASATVRPWIKIKSIQLRESMGPIKTLMFHWFPTGATMPPQIQITGSVVNVGQSVAQDVYFIAEFFFAKFATDTWHDVVAREEERFCDFATQSIKPGTVARIAFPLEPLDSYMAIGGIVHDADIVRNPGSPVTYSAASLILCVNYRGAPSTHYQSEASAGLYEDNSIYIAIGRDVDASHLKLIRDPTGDHAK